MSSKLKGFPVIPGGGARQRTWCGDGRQRPPWRTTLFAIWMTGSYACSCFAAPKEVCRGGKVSHYQKKIDEVPKRGVRLFELGGGSWHLKHCRFLAKVTVWPFDVESSPPLDMGRVLWVSVRLSLIMRRQSIDNKQRSGE